MDRSIAVIPLVRPIALNFLIHCIGNYTAELNGATLVT